MKTTKKSKLAASFGILIEQREDGKFLLGISMEDPINWGGRPEMLKDCHVHDTQLEAFGDALAILKHRTELELMFSVLDKAPIYHPDALEREATKRSSQ